MTPLHRKFSIPLGNAFFFSPLFFHPYLSIPLMDGVTVEVVEIADYRETRFCVARQIGKKYLAE